MRPAKGGSQVHGGPAGGHHLGPAHHPPLPREGRALGGPGPSLQPPAGRPGHGTDLPGPGAGGGAGGGARL